VSYSPFSNLKARLSCCTGQRVEVGTPKTPVVSRRRMHGGVGNVSGVSLSSQLGNLGEHHKLSSLSVSGEGPLSQTHFDLDVCKPYVYSVSLCNLLYVNNVKTFSDVS